MSSVPDEESGEVGGLQNTLTNLGASIGTAVSGAVLIAALTTSLIALCFSLGIPTTQPVAARSDTSIEDGDATGTAATGVRPPARSGS